MKSNLAQLSRAELQSTAAVRGNDVLGQSERVAELVRCCFCTYRKDGLKQKQKESSNTSTSSYFLSVLTSDRFSKGVSTLRFL